MDDGQGGAISTSGGGRNPKLRRLLIIQGLCSDLGFSGGVSNSCAERGRYADQLFVKQCYRRPVGPASMCTLSMYRLNCSFELKPAGAPALETLGEMTFRLFD